MTITNAQKALLSTFMDLPYGDDISYNELMPIIRKINDIGKAYQFAIFKTYVSCTVESGGKFYKDFSFSHAEYITAEQSDIEAMFRMIAKFIIWYNEINLDNKK